MPFLDRIRACNSHDPEAFHPFWVNGARVGWVHRSRVFRLSGFGDIFEIDHAGIHMTPGLGSVDERSRALAEVVDALADDGIRRRGEIYAVRQKYADPPVMLVDRGGVPFFGFRAYGVHMNGYVRAGNDIHMWIGRRAADRVVCPDMLDNMVAGGQPANLGLLENLIKECGEEAAIPPETAARAVPVGAITYCMEAPEGLKPDVMFCYDLELPADFKPENTDGEIADFTLMPVAEVATLVRDTQEFKFNCNLVIIDFLLRHGVIPPEHPDYLDLLKGLRQ